MAGKSTANSASTERDPAAAPRALAVRHPGRLAAVIMLALSLPLPLTAPDCICWLGRVAGGLMLHLCLGHAGLAPPAAARLGSLTHCAMFWQALSVGLQFVFGSR